MSKKTFSIPYGMKDLKNRIAIAILIGVSVIAGIYSGEMGLSIILAIILGFATWELGIMQIKDLFFARILNLIVSIVLFGFFLCLRLRLTNLNSAIFMVGLIFACCAIYVITYAKDGIKTFSSLIFTLCYLTVPISLILFINPNHEYDPNLLMGIIGCIWVCDTGAYMIGSKFGKNKLYPALSPNKSWEGVFGGLFSSMIFGAIWYVLWEDAIELKYWIPVILIVVLFSITGDLVESALKRYYSVKDSSNTLGEHGGFLDRFDALIFMAPFLVIFLRIIKDLY